MSSRTDFFVDMSGKILSRQRQLSTKHCMSGNKCSDVPTKIQLRVTQWIIRTGRVNGGGYFKYFKSSISEGLFYLYFVFTCILSFSSSTLLYQQNKMFVDMSYFRENCCFVSYFVDKALVDDSTTKILSSTATPFVFFSSSTCTTCMR